MQAQPDAHRSRTARRPYAATSGAMLAAIPVPWAVACWAHGGAFGHFPAWVVGILATGTLALGAAGFALPLRARLGRVLATVGVLSLPALAAPRLWQSPGLTLLLALVAVVTLGALWGFGSALLVPRLHRGPLGSARVRSSAAVALIFWLAVENVRDHPTTAELVTVGASMLIALGLGVAWILRTWRRSGARTRILSGGVLATASLSAVTWSDPWSLVGSGAVYAVIAAVFGPRTSRSDSPQGSWWAGLLEHPERMLVTTFAIMAAVGTLVLALPQSSATGTGVGVLDAAFTAVSAVCVTGLVVLDTPTDFSPVGHVAILALMQLGGLGIMTFSTAALRMLGRRLSLREESAVARLIGTKDRSRLITSAQDVLRITFVVEGAGALLLTILFLAHGDDLADALWRGVFTAVSAFCNAGFAMQSDSLVPYPARTTRAARRRAADRRRRAVAGGDPRAGVAAHAPSPTAVRAGPHVPGRGRRAAGHRLRVLPGVGVGQLAGRPVARRQAAQRLVPVGDPAHGRFQLGRHRGRAPRHLVHDARLHVRRR
ncbi:MAG: hypothetical protein IPM29_03780 [Planctomycetes bacterium]|nr:hypothetical protein [Planctomycetota bacterium]